MSAPRAWVVSDQSSNHRAILAFVRRCVREVGDFDVTHVFLRKEQLDLRRAENVKRAVRDRRRGVDAREPLLVFRDSECRTEPELTARRADMDGLLTELRGTYPNTFGLAFNPMSEAAFLLFDDAMTQLCAFGGTESGLLRQLARERRASRVVNKDRLDTALGFPNHRFRKEKLDEQMAALLFDAALPPSGHAPYQTILGDVVGVLRAGLRTDLQ